MARFPVRSRSAFRWTLVAGAFAAVLAVTQLPSAGASAPPPPSPLDTGAGVTGHWTPRPATFGSAVQHDIPITMTDGTVLAADVYRPAVNGKAAPGKFPVVLSQTPYNKNLPGANFEIPYLVNRGYVQVIADARGTGSSGGTWVPFQEREQRDGFELTNWTARQPWSDGKVALYGASYGAINQLLTAEQQPAALKAMFPIVPGGDPYRDVFSGGGTVDTGFMPLWLSLVTGAGMLPPAYSPADPQRAAATLLQHLGGAVSFQGAGTASALTGGQLAFDGPYFRSIAALDRIAKVTVPTFVVGGEYDLFQRSEPQIFRALQRNKVPTRLLDGPWYHIQGSMGMGLPAGGVPSLNDLALRWFDHYVRGAADPGLDNDIAPVTYNEIGTGQFKRASSWPPPGVNYRALPLGGAATPFAANLPMRGGTLGAGSTGSPDTLPFLPTAGVCGRSTTQWTAGGALPCDTDNRLADVGGLSYDLPITAPVKLAGPLAAHLTMSSAAKDAAITVRVEDVAPNGHVDQLTSGTQVLSLRALDDAKTEWVNGFAVIPYHPMTKASEQSMPANQPQAVDIEVFPTGAILQPGHRLRVTIQAADFPQHLPTVPSLLNSVGNLAGGLKLWHDDAHPSYLVAPFLP